MTLRLLLPLLVAVHLCHAQDPAALLREPPVRAALDAAKSIEAKTIEQQIRICEIPAPPFHENSRGEELKRLFMNAGLRDVRIDKAGNVIGTRPGRSEHPHLVISAHLDTVFPEGTNVKVTRDGTILKGPGIGDDCRGLVASAGHCAVARRGKVQTPGTITFVADVGEEGLGDLRGMKNLFNESMKGEIDKFVSIDGTGFGIVTVGRRQHALSRDFHGTRRSQLRRLRDGQSDSRAGTRDQLRSPISKCPAIPRPPSMSAAIGGGTSINAIAVEAWMEVDMRSSDVASLNALDRKFHAAVRAAADEENRRWHNRGKVSVSIELVGARPAGQTPVNSPIVQTALAVSRALGIEEDLRESSTDSNVPMNLNIPAITIGGGGKGSRQPFLGRKLRHERLLVGHPARSAARDRAGAVSLIRPLRPACYLRKFPTPLWHPRQHTAGCSAVLSARTVARHAAAGRHRHGQQVRLGDHAPCRRYADAFRSAARGQDCFGASHAAWMVEYASSAEVARHSSDHRGRGRVRRICRA